MSEIFPSYVDMNFDSIKQDIQDKMSESPVFQDYKYDASNITILIELMAYLGELTTYYVNKLAKNVYIDTVDLRENVIRLGYLVGYYPKGDISARTTLTVEVPSGTCNTGDRLRANAWKELTTNDAIQYDDNVITFTSTNDSYVDVTNGDASTFISVPVAQGTFTRLEYHGSDLIDETLYLPLSDYGYDDNITDSYPSVQVRIGGEGTSVETDTGDIWTRIPDFYYDISGLPGLDEDNDNVYTMRYNKYGQYIIRFSSVRNVPTTNQLIVVYLIETLGVNGNIGAKNTATGDGISNPEDGFITVIPTVGSAYNLTSDQFTITHSAATGGSAEETNDEIKAGIEGMVNSQYRCVTSSDYQSYLESHTLVSNALAWGERDVCLRTVPASAGNILDYNKVYLSINPSDWTGNLNYVTNSDGINIAGSYTTSFIETISEYLEPRKMLCAYEEYVVPDFTYFRFNISVKIKSNYRFENVRNDILEKLIYYFTDREFGEVLSFMSIANYIMDYSITSSDSNFSYVKGIYYLNIRDIDFYNLDTETFINPFDYGSTTYPQWAVSPDTTNWEENTLRDIQLDFNQFPMIDITNCIITEDH